MCPPHNTHIMANVIMMTMIIMRRMAMMIMIDDDDRKNVWCWWWSWIIDDDVVGENDNDHDDKRKVWAAQWCVLGAATLLSGPSHAPLLMTISMMAMAMMMVIRNYDDDHSDENYHAGDSEKTLTYPQPPFWWHPHQCITVTNAITSNISLSRWFHLEFLLFLITRNAIVCAASLLTLI